MSEEKLSLQVGIAYMERCLDAELAAQRQVAHSAIDMDDWNKAQEILAASKEAISRVEVIRAKFAEFKKSVGDVDFTAEKVSDAQPSEEKKEKTKPAEKTEAKADAKGYSFATAVEELIEKYPFAMAVCNAVPNMNSIFTYDEVSAKGDMKKPVQLSNGMWAETAIPEDKARLITDALRKYCESRKQQG